MSEKVLYTIKSCSTKEKMLKGIAITFSEPTVKDHYKINELSFSLPSFIGWTGLLMSVKENENLLKIRNNGSIFF